MAEQNLHLVRNVVKHSFRRYALCDQDDLEGAGMIGLLRAAERFDEGRGWQFKTYAERVIRGAILDWLRNNGTLIRRRRTNNRLEPELCVDRLPADQDLDPAIHDHDLAGVDQADDLRHHLRHLDEDERAVVTGAIVEGRTIAEMASQLRLSASHAHRVKAGAVGYLRQQVEREKGAA